MALKENFILQPGNSEEAAKYREKIYYFSSAEAKERFLEQPEEYVDNEEPLKVKTMSHPNGTLLGTYTNLHHFTQ